jgi:pimeloyl-ACP methyl ester carboxylesterase
LIRERSHSLRTSDGYRMAYREFGEGPHALLCVHGLYRSGRDFDLLARALGDRYRVITPDIIGRGDSDYATDVSRYNNENYVRDLRELIEALGLESYDYLGTSMGGMLGMALAAQPDSGIRKLILNDVGPEIALTTLKEIGGRSLASPPAFPSYEKLSNFFRAAFASWGALTEEQLAHLTRHSVYEDNDGRWQFRYDRELIKGFRWPDADVDLWPLYRAFKGPVLVFHGARSEVLLPSTAEKLRREPNTEVVEVSDAGHAPALMAPEQTAWIRRFLDA